MTHFFPCHGNSKEIMVAPDREYILIVIQECFVAKWRKAMIMKSTRNRTSNIVYIDMKVLYIYIYLFIYVYAVFPPARHAFEATLMYWLPCGTCAIYFCADVHSYNARAFKQDRFRKVDASSFLWLSTSR